MTINLNKEIVSKEGLLRYIREIDVYRFYTDKEVNLTGAILSPLRDETNASFGYFLNDRNEVCFNDFGIGGGDFVKFVELKFGLNFFEALSKICIDFNLTKHFFYKEVKRTSKDYDPSKFQDRDKLLATANALKIGKSSRDWKFHDLAYWMSYGIDSEVLEKYSVSPINYIFINEKPIRADKYAYSFSEYKDGMPTYKIYQPFNKEYKWLNNHNNSVWQGWAQLPKKEECLILTKSLKDVMSIVSTTDYPSVALQTEAAKPKHQVMEELFSRFGFVYILYDNDFDADINWGQRFASNLCKDYHKLKNIWIPHKYECKDYSDLVKKVGPDKAHEILNDLILNYIPF